MVDDIEDLLAGVEASVDVASASASSSSSSRQVFPAHYRNKKQYRQEKYGNKPKKSKLERQQERQQQHQAVASSQSGGGKPRIDFDDYDTLALSNGGVSVSHASSSGERERKEKQRAEEGDPNQGSRLPKGHLPGRGKVFLRTWGCSHNSSDGEYMAGQLASEGFELTDNKAEADVWVLNSCTVKNPSQDTFVNAIKDGREMFGVPVVVTGCVPQGQKNHKEWKDLSMIGVQQIDRVAEVVEQAINGNVVQIMDTKKTGGAALDLPKIRKNELIEIIPINTGCLNQCTYCKTKHARGNLRSYPPAEILARVDQVLAQGIKEIWLTSEDTGTYGRDIGHSLPDLLWRIAEKLPMGVMLRVGMTNPPYILEYLEELVPVFRHPRVYSFLHVPVQSGSNRVLEDMRREYTCEQFVKVVDFLRDNVPDMTIASDVICGFPTETKDDWDDTMRLCEDKKLPILYISQFYPRQGTPAARMARVPTKEVKMRSRALTTLFDSYTTRDGKVGLEFNVLVTQLASDKVSLVGHNKCYDQVLLSAEKCAKGDFVRVRIHAVGKHFLKGTVLRKVTLEDDEDANEDVAQLKTRFYAAAEQRIRSGVRGNEEKTQQKLANLTRNEDEEAVADMKQQPNASASREGGEKEKTEARERQLAKEDEMFRQFSKHFLVAIILVTLAAIARRYWANAQQPFQEREWQV